MKSFALASIALTLCSTPLWACQTPDNLVPNCALTSNAVDWNATAGTCAHSATPGSSGGTGNLTCNSFAGAFGSVSRVEFCVLAARGVTGGKVYRFGGFGQRSSGTGATCNILAADFTSDNCQNNVNSLASVWTPAATPSYSPSPLVGYPVAANTLSIRLQFECTNPTAFQVRFDDVFLIDDGLLRNGFEAP